MADTEKDRLEKPPLGERYAVALDALRRSRWVIGELTNTEMKEQVQNLAPWVADEFAFYDEHVVSTVTGIRITDRGRLYVKMMDGL